jgi:hypothetical protein
MPLEVWGLWPTKEDDTRSALWPEVALVVPLRAQPPTSPTELDLLFVKRVILPRVPVPGEQVNVAGGWAVVEKVRWERDFPATVRTEPLPDTLPNLVDDLEEDGFRLVPREDADDWLSRLTGD